MPRNYSKGKRDANEAEIVEYLRLRGCEIIQMREGQGCDLIAILPDFPDTHGAFPSHGGPQIIEIKNPAESWKLTEAEQKLQAACKERGVHYWIFETVEQVQQRMI